MKFLKVSVIAMIALFAFSSADAQFRKHHRAPHHRHHRPMRHHH